MRRSLWSSKTSKNWWIVHASRDEFTTVSQLMAQIRELENKVQFLVWRARILRSWVREQLCSDPRSRSSFYDSESRDLAALRFWIAAKYTELHKYYGRRFWTTTCSRRTILYDSQQFKEFGIFLSRIETWYYRYIKTKWWNEKRIVGHTDSSTSLSKQKWHLSHAGGIYSQSGMVQYPRSSIAELNFGKFLESMEFQSWKTRAEVCQKTADPHVTMPWRSQNQSTILRHSDRLRT